MRLLPASREILRALEICPWVPVDVLAALSGARSHVSVYQALARLAAVGFVQKRQSSVGPPAGRRQIALWSTTKSGQEALRQFGVSTGEPDGEPHIGSSLVPSPTRVAHPGRVAAAHALAGWLAIQRAVGRSVNIAAWHAPSVQGPLYIGGRRLKFPAAALVEFADQTGTHAQHVIVVPDLGTAPIARLHATLRRLFESLATERPKNHQFPLSLLIVTTSVDGTGARRLAWLQLIQRLEAASGASPVDTEILDWTAVYRVLGVHVPSGFGSGGTREVPQQRTRSRRADEMLDLLGRHPFLTMQQLADLLAITPRRARQLRQSLVQEGLVRVLTRSDLGPHDRAPLARCGGAIADLAELTAAGRGRVARRFGLPVAAARRHHGLFGGSPQHRQRALRHLSHTIGANQVFVTLAVAARAARKRGADEALEEWRPAAACEHWRCKPDGYGRYREGNKRFGFLLEYDRGSERAAQYDAKFAAYYAYSVSGQAATHYADLPIVLFVTSSEPAEARITAATERALARRGDLGFSFLTTTTARLAAFGLLDRIWRAAPSDGLVRLSRAGP